MRLLFCAVFAAGFAFADAVDKSYFVVTFGIPYVYEALTEDGTDAESETSALSVGFMGQRAFSDVIGLFYSVDYIMPQSTSYSTDSISYRYKRRDFDTIWALSFFVAPSLYFFRTEKITFSVAPGLHLLTSQAAMPYDGGKLRISEWAIGTGANVFFAWHFSHSVFLSASLEFTVDFFSERELKMARDRKTENLDAVSLTVLPRVGVGVRL